MSNSDIVLRAIRGRVSGQGYARTTLTELAADTALSTSTIQRAIQQLIAGGHLEKHAKRGPAGGMKLRLTNRSQTGQNSGQNSGQVDRLRDVSTQAPGPSALGGLLASPNPVTNRSEVYRQARPGDTPLSGAELVYTNDAETGIWRRLNATLWIAPNGDAVSVRSMTPERRRRCRVEENEDGSPNREAIRAIRGILDR